MRAQILNEIGNVVNTVVADVAYLDAKYPGHWREEILFDEDGNPSPPAEEVVAPHDPLTRLAFIRRFTMLGRIAMQGSDDPIVRDGILLLTNAEEALVDDPDTIAFVGYVQQQGYITAERAVEILKA